MTDNSAISSDSLMVLTDEELLRRIADTRDGEAMRLLCERVLPSLYRTARVLCEADDDADDAVQNTMLRVWQHPNRGVLAPGSFQRWAHAVLLNQIRGSMHRKRALESRFHSHPPKPATAGDEPPHRLENIQHAIELLCERDRRLMEAYANEIPYTEIAAELGMTPEACQQRLHRVLHHLRVDASHVGAAE